ncbi:MAG: hypothetical protein V7L17_31615 [Nostoc sp.]
MLGESRNAPRYLAVRYAVANAPYKIGYFFNWKSLSPAGVGKTEPEVVPPALIIFL